jgi:ABC-type sugar transport system permease subunit
MVSIYEAAKIDGASNVQSFFHITIPTLKNTIAFLSIYSIIGAMKFFDIIYITTDGGPGYSTEILGTYIFKLVFRQQKVGLGSAVAVILFIIVSIMSLLILRRRNNE